MTEDQKLAEKVAHLPEGEGFTVKGKSLPLDMMGGGTAPDILKPPHSLPSSEVIAYIEFKFRQRAMVEAVRRHPLQNEVSDLYARVASLEADIRRMRPPEAE